MLASSRSSASAPVLAVVRGPSVQRRAQDGRDDQHVGGAHGVSSHLGAESRVSARLMRDEEDPPSLRLQLVNHRSSILRGHRRASRTRVAQASAGTLIRVRTFP